MIFERKKKKRERKSTISNKMCHLFCYDKKKKKGNHEDSNDKVDEIFWLPRNVACVIKMTQTPPTHPKLFH